MRSIIYLAAPYTHPDQIVVECRIDAFCRVAAFIELDGHYHVISSLFNQLLVDRKCQIPVTSEFWRSNSISLVGISDVLGLIHLPGYDISPGVKVEVTAARSRGIPVLDLTHKNVILSPKFRDVLFSVGA